MKTKHLHILRHSLGLDENGHGNQYRNYYCTGKDCDGYADILELERLGMMRLYLAEKDSPNEFFTVTDSGRKEALKDVVYPKFTRSQLRYQRFLNAKYAFGMSFRQFIEYEKRTTA